MDGTTSGSTTLEQFLLRLLDPYRFCVMCSWTPQFENPRPFFCVRFDPECNNATIPLTLRTCQGSLNLATGLDPAHRASGLHWWAALIVMEVCIPFRRGDEVKFFAGRTCFVPRGKWILSVYKTCPNP